MNRHYEILKAIIQCFIETAKPVGSQTIVMDYHLHISPATVRNEMMTLEDEGLIFQPYISSGRVPTDLGYRMYVDEMMDLEQSMREAEKTLARILRYHKTRKAREKIYDAVSILAQATENVSFATLPDNRRTFYLGISNVLKQPEFMNDPMRASQVMEVLENTNRFVKILHSLPIDENPKIFIGKENILKQIQSCSMIVASYAFDNFKGYIGVLGPTRMRYPYNTAILRKVKELL